MNLFNLQRKTYAAMYLEDVEQSDEKKKDYMFYAIKDFQFVRSGVDNIPLK